MSEINEGGLLEYVQSPGVEERGIEPVRRTVRSARVRNVKAKVRQKYASRSVQGSVKRLRAFTVPWSKQYQWVYEILVRT